MTQYGRQAPHLDVAAFMDASEQRPGIDLASLYFRLVKEEFDELATAWEDLTSADLAVDEGSNMLIGLVPASESFRASVEGTLDGLADLIWVAYGMMMAMGANPDALWAEITRANMDKIDPALGRVLKRGDGKVQKPEGWRGPDHAKQVLMVESGAIYRKEKIIDGHWRRADGTFVS